MIDLMKTIWESIKPPKKTPLAQARAVLNRDPDLRQIRRDHRNLEVRVSALEVQARVRARRH